MGPEALLFTAIAGGTALQTAGALRAGDAADSAAKANARAAQIEGDEAMATATARAEARTREARRIVSRQRALLAEQAGDPGSGTLAEVQADTAEQARLDALAEMYGGRQAKANADYEAKALKAQGRGAKQAGYIQAGSSILQGAGQAGLAYGRMRSPAGSTNYGMSTYDKFGRAMKGAGGRMTGPV